MAQRKPAAKPETLPMTERLEGFEKDLNRISKKWGLALQPTVQLAPITDNGTYGLKLGMNAVEIPAENA